MSVVNKRLVKNLVDNLSLVITDAEYLLRNAQSEHNQKPIFDEIKAKNEVYELNQLENFIEVLKGAKNNLGASFEIKL